ncbi:MAG: hypothetical protein KJ623_01980 [Nanoarchaeota archaeon]|nr:hypothetical protein [Nanoarchaeota archaeon]MBU0963383.1 hypothetical protein [Nanoarchaeota archaeon]
MTKRTLVGIVPHNNREKIKRGINSNKNLVPNCYFSLIDYYNLLLQVSNKKNDYNMIIFYKISNNTHENICVASYEIRQNYDNTLFIVSFNPLEEKIHKKNVEMEKMYIDKLFESDINGIVLTSSTDEAFLLNIIRDMTAAPEIYLKGKYKIETQKDFLVYDPGHTEVGRR